MEFLFHLLRRLDLSADLLGPLIFAIPWIIRTIRKARAQQPGDAETQQNASQQRSEAEPATAAQRAAARDRKLAVAAARRAAASLLRRKGGALAASAETSRQRASASHHPLDKLRHSLLAEGLHASEHSPPSAQQAAALPFTAERPSPETAAPSHLEQPGNAAPKPWHPDSFRWPDADDAPQGRSAFTRPHVGRRRATALRIDRSLIVDAVVLQAALSPRGARPRRL